MSGPTDADAGVVLGRFGLPAAPAQPLGNYGGFSGARIWRISTGQGDLCLKAWPLGGMTAQRHREIVRLIRHARQAGLPFIPTTSNCVEHLGHFWDLADWMPGVADFRAAPTPSRMRAACVAIAQLHVAWREFESPPQRCPAIIRRLIAAGEWIDGTVSSVSANFELIDFWRTSAFVDPLSPWPERARVIVRERIRDIPHLLEPWLPVPLPAQPCLCDVWHDHVLFAGDKITGLIDYGSMKDDNVAADLARLLGSLAGNDLLLYETGLDAYASIRPLSVNERRLVALLDHTGVVLGLAGWLRRIFQKGSDIEDRAAVAARMSELVVRVDTWNGRWGFA